MITLRAQRVQDQFAVEIVVLHNEQPAPYAASLRDHAGRRRLRGQALDRGSIGGPIDQASEVTARETGTLVERGFDGYPAALLFDHAPDQSQAESRALVTARIRPVDLVELVEDPFQVRGIDSYSGVRDTHQQVGAVALGADGHGAVSRRELHRVAEQVEQDLAEHSRVQIGPLHVRRAIHVQGKVLLRGLGGDYRERFLDRRGHVEPLAVDLHSARLDLG